MEAPPIIKQKQKQIKISLNEEIYDCKLILNENKSKIEVEIFSNKNNIKQKGEISINELKSKIPSYMGLNENEIFDELCDAKSYELTKENNLKIKIILIVFKKEMIIEIELREIKNILKENMEKIDLFYEKIINQKDETIKQQNEIIKQSEEIIK